MTEKEKVEVLFRAFRDNLKVKVVRDCFEHEEVCIGYVNSISLRERPYTESKNEFCFSMCSNEDWWINGTMYSLSPWISQVTIELTKEK